MQWDCFVVSPARPSSVGEKLGSLQGKDAHLNLLRNAHGVGYFVHGARQTDGLLVPVE